MVRQINDAQLYDATKFKVLLNAPNIKESISSYDIPKLQNEEQVNFIRLKEATERFDREQAEAEQPKHEEEVTFGRRIKIVFYHQLFLLGK